MAVSDISNWTVSFKIKFIFNLPSAKFSARRRFSAISLRLADLLSNEFEAKI